MSLEKHYKILFFGVRILLLILEEIPTLTLLVAARTMEFPCTMLFASYLLRIKFGQQKLLLPSRSSRIGNKTKFSPMENKLVSKKLGRGRQESNPWTWSDRTSETCNQATRRYFRVGLKLRHLQIAWNHLIKFSSDRFDGWSERTCWQMDWRMNAQTCQVQHVISTKYKHVIYANANTL